MWCLLALAAAHARSVSAVSPVEHVTTLLQDLQTKVQTEGAAEAEAYETFACFCKDKTTNTDTEITTQTLHVASLEADIKQLDGSIQELTGEILQYEHDLDTMDAEQTAAADLRENEQADFEVARKDAEIATSQLEAAIESIEGGLAFVQVQSKIAPIVALATSLKIAPKEVSLLGSIKSSSANADVLGTLDNLLQAFQARTSTLTEEEGAAKTNFETAADNKRTEYDTAKDSLSTKQGLLATAQEDRATSQEDLTETQALLVDNQAYLKELSAQCEARAKEWDQRSTLRKDELEAIGTALELITGEVTTQASATENGGREALAQKGKKPLKKVVTALFQDVKEEPYVDIVSFVQTAADTSMAARRTRVVDLLASNKNARIAALAVTASSDPFAKVKTTIQSLIERLIESAQAASEHKGWCDTETAKGETSRDYRLADTKSLNSQLEIEEARKAELEHNEEVLNNEIGVLNTVLTDITTQRGEEKEANRVTIQAANDGLAALRSAIKTLEAFYRRAGRATVAKAPTMTTDSLVGADMADAGTSAATGESYQGGQQAGAQVMGALETVEADFMRTVKEATDAEAQAMRDFASFSKETKASITNRQTGLSQTQAELKTTTSDLEAHMEDLRMTQGLLDSSLETLEKLLPSCMHAGTSYEEQVERRDAEIASLKYAICIMDDDGTDAGLRCEGGGEGAAETAAETAFLQRK